MSEKHHQTREGQTNPMNVPMGHTPGWHQDGFYITNSPPASWSTPMPMMQTVMIPGSYSVWTAPDARNEADFRQSYANPNENSWRAAQPRMVSQPSTSQSQFLYHQPPPVLQRRMPSPTVAQRPAPPQYPQQFHGNPVMQQQFHTPHEHAVNHHPQSGEPTSSPSNEDQIEAVSQLTLNDSAPKEAQQKSSEPSQPQQKSDKPKTMSWAAVAGTSSVGEPSKPQVSQPQVPLARAPPPNGMYPQALSSPQMMPSPWNPSMQQQPGIMMVPNMPNMVYRLGPQPPMQTIPPVRSQPPGTRPPRPTHQKDTSSKPIRSARGPKPNGHGGPQPQPSQNGDAGLGAMARSRRFPNPRPDLVPSQEVLDILEHEAHEFNPKEFNAKPENARYFVIKSYSEDDVFTSIKHNVWTSTQHGNKRLDQAFRQQKTAGGHVYLFFSVNGSGHFCGLAEMVSTCDFNKTSGLWAQDKWKGEFKVRWVFVKDVPNGQFRQIRVPNNENKPVTNSRDTQEIMPAQAHQVLHILSTFKAKSSVFDDFLQHHQRNMKRKKQPTTKDSAKSPSN